MDFPDKNNALFGLVSYKRPLYNSSYHLPKTTYWTPFLAIFTALLDGFQQPLAQAALPRKVEKIGAEKTLNMGMWCKGKESSRSSYVERSTEDDLFFGRFGLDGICLSTHVLKPRALVCVCETQFEDVSHLTTSETRASLNLLLAQCWDTGIELDATYVWWTNHDADSTCAPLCGD